METTFPCTVCGNTLSKGQPTQECLVCFTVQKTGSSDDQTSASHGQSYAVNDSLVFRKSENSFYHLQSSSSDDEPPVGDDACFDSEFEHPQWTLFDMDDILEPPKDKSLGYFAKSIDLSTPKSIDSPAEDSNDLSTVNRNGTVADRNNDVVINMTFNANAETIKNSFVVETKSYWSDSDDSSDDDEPATSREHSSHTTSATQNDNANKDQKANGWFAWAVFASKLALAAGSVVILVFDFNNIIERVTNLVEEDNRTCVGWAVFATKLVLAGCSIVLLFFDFFRSLF